MPSFKSGFTLVEVLVVFAILATLSTIAVVSYFSHFGDTRDALRISDIELLDSRAAILLSSLGRLPNPENSVQLTASGVLVGRQGYASAQTLAAFGIEKGALDPTDKTPYVYALDSTRRRAHFLAFFENSGPERLTFSPGFEDVSIIPTAHAAVNYSVRKPGGTGKFGVLLAATTQAPVQDAAATVDIVKTTSQYVAYLQRNRKITGTGTVIAELNPAYSCARLRETGTSKSGTYVLNPLGTNVPTFCPF
jgi:prepilin-type N-terminal cleavage/methylation domain-containing protein